MANLITLSDYRTLENINSSADDDFVTALIPVVSDMIKTYCGRSFIDYIASPGKTEIFDIQWDTHVVQLSEFPVISVLNVYERDSQDKVYTEIFKDGTNDEYNWYFDPISDSVLRTQTSGVYRLWPKGVGSVKVVYTGGYATIPGDLKMAAVDLVTYYKKDEHKLRMSIASSTIERQGTAQKDSGFPDHIRRVLDLYRVI